MSYSLRGSRLDVNGINVDLLILHVQLEMDHECNGETLISNGPAVSEARKQGQDQRRNPSGRIIRIRAVKQAGQMAEGGTETSMV
jgi:hypothetical protein